MSKQEKLAALIEAVDNYCLKITAKNTWGAEVKTAYDDWRNAPDDPPPRPEMPECVRALLDRISIDFYAYDKARGLAQAVRDHYAHPLKLEVGKVYEDGAGEVVDIVWHDPKVANHFVGVFRRTGEPDRYRQDGSCCGGTASEKLIREVTNG